MKQKWIALLLAALLLTLAGCAAQPTQSTEAPKQETTEAVKEETTQAKETEKPSRAESLLADAEAGSGRAYTDLGKLYEQGTGVEQDYEKALEYYLLSAEAETPDFKGMRLAGLLYMNGTGVAQDMAKAAECFQKAAEAGDVSACWFLGQFYEQGTGVEQDMAKAKQSYELGLTDLERFTGGGNKGPDELKQILCRLAELALEEGDTETAVSYYQIAADLGWEAAQQALTELGTATGED